MRERFIAWFLIGLLILGVFSPLSVHAPISGQDVFVMMLDICNTSQGIASTASEIPAVHEGLVTMREPTDVISFHTSHSSLYQMMLVLDFERPPKV